MKITVFTIAYNGYGLFIPRWLQGVQSQIYPAHEIIVVLGYKHGLRGIPHDVKIIYHEQPATMGFYRNLALDHATGDYVFYFSADDILLGNALKEISNVNAELIALRYYRGAKVDVTPEVVAEKLIDWKTEYTGAAGYVAFKHGLDLRYEDTDWPNYPFLFQAFINGYTFGRTKEPGAYYNRWFGGHSQYESNVKQGMDKIKKYLLQYGLIQIMREAG